MIGHEQPEARPNPVSTAAELDHPAPARSLAATSARTR